MLRRFFHAFFGAHYRLERYSMGLTIGIIFAASIGGFIEIAPLFTIDETVEDAPDMRVYTPLEQAGRDIYTREGCYACHSQMIRTPARRGRSLGSVLAGRRVEVRPPDAVGLEAHRAGPRAGRRQVFRRMACGASGGAAGAGAGVGDARIPVPAGRAARGREPARAALPRCARVGVPYTDDMIANASADALGQALPDGTRPRASSSRYGEATNVRAFDGRTDRLTEMDALVAYLQILGGLTDLAAVAEAQAEE